MKYSPLRKDNKASATSFIFAVFAVVLFVLSAFVSRFSAFYQITALILAVFSIQVYIKYVLCEYVYEATDSVLMIFKVNGSKSTCVASLNYEASKSMCLTRKEFNKAKADFPKYKYTVNYAKNIYPKHYSIYMFDFNGKTVRMKFEPDDVFSAYLNKKIKAFTE